MKTIDLIDAPKIHGLPIDHIPMRAADTGIPLKRLYSLVLRNGLRDPIGYVVDGELVVYNDWRLRELQQREGVPVSPDPSSLILVAVIH